MLELQLGKLGYSFRLTHFLGSRLLRTLCLCSCRDAGLLAALGCCVCGSAVDLETSLWFTATDIRPSRGLTAMDAVADAEDLRTEFTSIESVFIGRMEVCWIFVVSFTKYSGHTV